VIGETIPIGPRLSATYKSAIAGTPKNAAKNP